MKDTRFTAREEERKREIARTTIIRDDIRARICEITMNRRRLACATDRETKEKAIESREEEKRMCPRIQWTTVEHSVASNNAGSRIQLTIRAANVGAAVR